MTRPKHTRPDANQPAERAKLREWGYVCVDVHNLAGNETDNPLDEFVMSPAGTWVQVEWKTGPSAPFTDNEVAYFKHVGVWDAAEARILEPLAQWRQHGQAVVVAWEAEQVRDVLAAMDERWMSADRLGGCANAAVDRVNCGARRGT